MRVLVADQDVDHRVSLVNYIEKLGHAVNEVLSEREVMDECRKQCPDLILVDHIVSGVSGIEMVRQIRLLGGHATWVPIILMANKADNAVFAQAIEAGADDYLIKPISIMRIFAKVRSAERFKNLKDEVFAVTHNLVLANRALENIATQDVLTGIGNSNSFDDTLEHVWFDAKRKNQFITLIILNLDFFQAYNQSYGATKGDDTIRRIAETLKLKMPKGNHSLARLSGETFALILSDTNGEQALKIAEELRASINALQIPHVNSGCSDHVTASFGLAIAEPGHYTSPWDLKEAADYALFQAKHQGRNRSFLVSASESEATGLKT